MNYNTQYKKLVGKILDKGAIQKSRNGNTLLIPHTCFTINAKDWRLNLRKMYYKGVKAEWDTLMDTNNPLTNVSQFEANGCPYWKLWAKEDGALNLDYYNELHPQLEDVIKNINEDPYSRRHVIDIWNHNHVQSGELSLASCWYGFIITVIKGVLYMTWNQRSCDVMLGLPADVYLAYLFLNHIAEETGFIMGNITFSITNVHIYEEHIQGAKELLTRTESNYNDPIKFELKA